MFRRRRRQREAEAGELTAADPGPQEPGGHAGDDPAPAVDRSNGPWDADEEAPEIERIDLGGLRIPVDGQMEIQVNVADDQIVAATVVHGDSAMQVQAFAAPKSSGLWPDVRREIAAELTEAGGKAEEADGPFGVEIRAFVPVEVPDQGVALQPARFIGVDGPRWFLRGVISGAAVEDPAAAAPLEEVFRGIVVVRGDGPMPPRELLELRLPPEARQALEEQMAQQMAENAQNARPDLNPFERGPEITEIR